MIRRAQTTRSRDVTDGPSRHARSGDPADRLSDATQFVVEMRSLKLLSRLSPWSSDGVRQDDDARARHDEELLRWLDDSLRRWAVGLPWVVERPPFRDRPELRCFAIDCEPLGLRRVWALIGPLKEETKLACTAHVVLPNWLADEAHSSGEGTIALALGEQHALVSLDPETKPDGIERLYSVLLLAYAAAFS